MKLFNIPKQRQADKELLSKITLEERQNYLKAMFKIPQVDGDISQIKKIKFPNQANFEFDGYRLNYSFIQVTNQPKAVLLYFHGMYCNSQNAGLLGQIVSKNTGMNVYALDFINAGKSQSDEPGYYKSVEYLVEQAYAFLQHILSKFQTQPKLFISGVSMGGLVCFNLGVKYSKLISGIIFMAPALREIYSHMYILKKIGKVLSFLAPKGRVIPQDFINRTKLRMEESLKEDKDNYGGKHVFGTAHGVLKGMKWASSNYKNLSSPYIAFQGGVDKYIDPFAAIDLERESQSKDKKTVIYKDMWHEVHNEVEYEEICQMSASWLKERL